MLANSGSGFWRVDPRRVDPPPPCYNSLSSHLPPPFVMNSTITVDGIQFKVTRLPIAHGGAALRWTDRIKGGSTRVRTGAGSRSVNQSTKATALGDVR